VLSERKNETQKENEVPLSFGGTLSAILNLDGKLGD
jgi:hypothetical protein